MQASVSTHSKGYVFAQYGCILGVPVLLYPVLSKTLTPGLTQELSSILPLEQPAMTLAVYSLEFRLYTRYGYRPYGYR